MAKLSIIIQLEINHHTTLMKRFTYLSLDSLSYTDCELSVLIKHFFRKTVQDTSTETYMYHILVQKPELGGESEGSIMA